MKDEIIGIKKVSEIWKSFSSGALSELKELGLSGPTWENERPRKGLDPVEGRSMVFRKAIQAATVLNEAYNYERPSSFSRGLCIKDVGRSDMILLSGTASVDEKGRTAYPGDFQAQCLRTYRNLTELLIAENVSWHDVVRTTCYLRDIERDYASFNEIRTLFFKEIGLQPLPASTGIQARLCWTDLLIEIELMALVPRGL